MQHVAIVTRGTPGINDESPLSAPVPVGTGGHR